MKKLLVGLMGVLLLAVFAFSAHAGEFAGLKKKINDARESIVVLLKNKDKRGPDQQKLVKESADEVSKTLAGMKAPAGKEMEFKELTETWADFKRTREDELVPLILSGNQAEAEKLAGGVQKDRFKKITELCDSLDKQ